MDQKMQNERLNHLNSPAENGAKEMTVTYLADKIIEKSLREFRKKQIKKEIDESLSQRNKEEFLKLTNELKRLNDL